MSNSSTTRKPVVRRETEPTVEPCFTVTLADGQVVRWLAFEDASYVAKAVATGVSLDDALEAIYGPPEPPTCSLCDAVGHGYPGAGPCPLEDRGYDTDGIWR